MDKERILSLLDSLENYHRELIQHTPENLQEYLKNIEKRRFCERTLQLSIEICIDLSMLIVRELKLGLPTEEENIFNKLHEAEVISEDMADILKGMKKFRNVLIHRYVKLDDAKVFENITTKYNDFLHFKQEILDFIKDYEKKKQKLNH